MTDAQNAAVPNADVALTVSGKILSQSKTGADGGFSIDFSGEDAILEVSAAGFTKLRQNVREIETNESLIIVLKPQNLREDVMVSITRAESRISETPASVVVLDKRTLETTAAQTVDDRLRQIAGFTLFRRGSSKTTNPTTQGANLRGLSGSGAARTAVLLDGLSLNDAFGGWTFWSRVPNIAVEQAEVLRGGASSFYGDTALSGAVNLITSQAKENQPILRFEMSAGTQKTFDGGIFAAYGKRGWNAGFAFESFQTAGYIPTAETERGTIDTKANSRHDNGFLTIEKVFDAQTSNSSSFNFSRIFLKTNIFSERRDNGTSLTNNQTYFRQLSGGADFSSKIFGAFQLRTFLENQIYDQTFSSVSSSRNTETLSRTQRVPSQAFGANLFWSKGFGADHFVSSSTEFRQVRGFSDETAIANNSFTSLVGSGGKEQAFSIFAQDFWRATKKLNINFGGRFDVWKNYAALVSTRVLSNNQTTTANFADRRETAFSPRIAAIYAFNTNFSAVASFSKSFRASTLR